jgi:hypothetical protein
MKLVIFNNEKSGSTSKELITIGKNGVVRFKPYHVEKFTLINKEHIEFAIDSEEKKVSSIYILRGKKSFSGWKTQNLNGRIIINANSFFEKISIELPIKCNVETFSHDENGNNLRGLKLTLIKN